MASNEVVTVQSIIQEAQNCKIPWNEVTTPAIGEWLSLFAKAKGTCKEFLLASCLPTVSALMGNSVVEIFEDYEERVNLYMLALGGPSTGKTQSHKNCVTQPILNSLEGKVGGELLLEDATSKGLFKFFSRCENRVALCAIDECQEWFKEIVGFKSSASAPSMKRLLQCYDGSHWYEAKGNTNKRVGVPSAALALSCFTQPDAFLKFIMPRMVANDNGLLDRFLISLPSTAPVSISARMESSRNLRNTNLTSFERLYERIYAKHNTADRVKYGLSQEALDVYIRHMSDSESQAVTATSGHSKDDKNIIRLAAVLHVLYSVMEEALNQRTEDIPRKISERTLNEAIALSGYFEKQRAILQQCSALGEVRARNVISDQEIQEAILKHPGPFVTPKRIYRKFSSRTRPDGDNVRSQMLHLEGVGLGTVKQVERSLMFYKHMPGVANTETLATFGVSAEAYAQTFNQIDEGLTDSQKEAAVAEHPNGEAYDNYIESQR